MIKMRMEGGEYMNLNTPIPILIALIVGSILYIAISSTKITFHKK